MAEETVPKLGFAENSLCVSESDEVHPVDLISDISISAKQFFEDSGESNDGSTFSSCLSPPSLIPIIEDKDNNQEERDIIQDDSLFDNPIPLPSLSCEVAAGRLKSNRKRNLPFRFCTPNSDYCPSASLSKQLKHSSSKKKKSAVRLAKKSLLNCKLKFTKKSRENEENSRNVCQNVDEIDGLSFRSFATLDELDVFCAKQSFNTNPSNAVVVDNSNIFTRLNAIEARGSVLCQSCFSQSTQERYSRFLANITEIEAKLSSCLPPEYSFQAGISAVIDALKLYSCFQ